MIVWACANASWMISIGALFFILSYLIFSLWVAKRPDEVAYDIETADNGFPLKGHPFLAKIAGFLNFWGIILLGVGGLSGLLCLFD